MSTKHTPGPWRLGKQSDDVVADVNAGHAQDQETLDFYGGHLVAESIAPRNRALIAAAPDLLALAYEMEAFAEAAMLDAVEAGEPTDEVTWRTRMESCRAAIAKATGGAA